METVRMDVLRVQTHGPELRSQLRPLGGESTSVAVQEDSPVRVHARGRRRSEVCESLDGKRRPAEGSAADLHRTIQVEGRREIDLPRKEECVQEPGDGGGEGCRDQDVGMREDSTGVRESEDCSGGATPGRHPSPQRMADG